MRGKNVAAGSSATVSRQRRPSRFCRSAAHCRQRPPTLAERAALPLVLLIGPALALSPVSFTPAGVPILAAVVALLLRAPFLIVVFVAAATAALLRFPF